MTVDHLGDAVMLLIGEADADMVVTRPDNLAFEIAEGRQSEPYRLLDRGRSANMYLDPADREVGHGTGQKIRPDLDLRPPAHAPPSVPATIFPRLRCVLLRRFQSHGAALKNGTAELTGDH